MAIVDPREMQQPQHQRRAQQRKLDEQIGQLKTFGKDRADAQEIIEGWKKAAWSRIETLSEIAFPIDEPKDPTTAAIRFGRIQGFMEPLRKALDTLGVTDQMQANIDKARDRLNELDAELEEEEEA